MVARVYGRFVPTSQERDRWESIAATLDEEEWGGRGALGSAGNEKALEPESPSTCDGDSRGGTRTHDPGIMSAVFAERHGALHSHRLDCKRTYSRDCLSNRPIGAVMRRSAPILHLPNRRTAGDSLIEHAAKHIADLRATDLADVLRYGRDEFLRKVGRYAVLVERRVECRLVRDRPGGLRQIRPARNRCCDLVKVSRGQLSLREGKNGPDCSVCLLGGNAQLTG